VIAINGDGTARVNSRPLHWDGRRLQLAAPREERAVLRLGKLGLSDQLRAGQWCALHWDWVCDRLDQRQLMSLRRYTLGQLAVVNAQPFPPPASVLG
jgi:hypothetical protein